MRFRNKKNGKLYELLGSAINCTNAQNGQIMFIYKCLESVEDGINYFVRERGEFYQKFEFVDYKENIK